MVFAFEVIESLVIDLQFFYSAVDTVDALIHSHHCMAVADLLIGPAVGFRNCKNLQESTRS